MPCIIARLADRWLIFPLKEEIMRLCPNLMLSGIARFVSTQIFFVKWAPPADWDRRPTGGVPLLIRHSMFPLAIDVDKIQLMN